MALEDEDDEQQQQLMKTETSNSSETSILTLLPEIIVDIFLKLPIKSILRCKSVCKLWCSLISDHRFIKLHLSLSINNNHYAHHHRVILCTVFGTDLKSFPLNDVLYDYQPVNELQLDYPSELPPEQKIYIVGSCDGLLCIFVDNLLCIWNPSTRRLNTLPYSGFKLRYGFLSRLTFGFGYDEFNDAYKVVGMESELREAKIYSLETGSWKSIGEVPNGVDFRDSGKFSNGCLHWVARQDFGKIVSFDLARETYGEVLQPAYDEGHDKYLTLGNLGECLCILCNYHEYYADVWVMKVYGVKDSWTKLASIPYDPDIERVRRVRVPFFITNDGKVLVQFGLKMTVYDYKNCSSYDIQNFDGWLRGSTYVESLVSPHAPAYHGDNNDDGI